MKKKEKGLKMGMSKGCCDETDSSCWFGLSVGSVCSYLKGIAILLIGLDLLLEYQGVIPARISNIIWPSLVMLVGVCKLVKTVNWEKCCK